MVRPEDLREKRRVVMTALRANDRARKTVALSIAALVLACVTLHAQGQFTLNNYVPPDINAEMLFRNVYDPVVPMDSSWSVSVLAGPAGTAIASMSVLTGSTTAFKPDRPGYLEPVTITVPGIPPGQRASVALVASGPFRITGTFGPFDVTLGGGTTPIPYLPLGTSPMGLFLVPEPQTLSLVLIAVAFGGVIYCERAPTRLSK